MSFKISEKFTLTKKENLKDLKTQVYFYEHKKTKASVIFLKNENENMSFGTFFKTPAENNKGTTHILEHCVFTGSEKFNKGDIMDFMKDNSLSSYLNAGTYIDATLYYFASSFQKDYFNLMNLYLDFVFFPKLDLEKYRREAHFFQKSEGKIDFNGIVFNEMKDSLLDYSSKLWYSMSEFYQKGPYSYESGGNPLDIVDLTLDELKDYHKKYYHPSNSCTIVYGKVNQKKAFSMLDEVFSRFEPQEEKISIQVTPVPENKSLEVSYQASGEKPVKNFVKYYLLRGIHSEEDFLSLDLGIYSLFAFDFSPVKRELEDSKLATTIKFEILSDLRYPIVAIICNGVSDGKEKQLEDLLDKSLRKHSKNLNPEIKEIIYKKEELRLKEIEFSVNQGIEAIMQMIGKIKLGYDPLIGLRGKKSLKTIEKILKGKRLEKFLVENFLTSQTLSILFVPSNNLLDEYKEKLDNKLKEKLSSIDINTLEKEIEVHEKAIGDGVETKNYTYPEIKKLSAKDLDIKVRDFEVKEKDSILYTEVDSSDITRLKIFFDISNFDESKYFYLNLYQRVSDQLGTKNFSFQDFSKIRNKHLATFSHTEDFTQNIQNREFLFTYNFYVKFLAEDTKQTVDYLKEFKENLVFDKDRLLFILKKILTRKKLDLENSPENFARPFAVSYHSPVSFYHYQQGSFPFLEKLEDLVKNFDQKFEELELELQNVHNYIFNQKCVVYFGTSKDNFSHSLNSSKEIISKLNLKVSSFDKFDFFNYHEFKNYRSNMPIESYYHMNSNSDSNTILMSLTYKDIPNENIEILKSAGLYLYDYLWERVRIIGGAYHASWSYDEDSSSSVFYSFSDPNIDSTIKTFDNLKNKYDISKLSKNSYEKLKVKGLSKYKLIYTNSMIFKRGIDNLISHRSLQYRKKLLDRVMKLDLTGYKELFNYLINVQSKLIVAIASKENLKKSKHKYLSIK